ncbi:hypothetical protein Emag_001992 [Eimeria magna]
MAVNARLLAALLAVFAFLALSWRCVCASDFEQTQQTGAAWEAETETGALSDASLAEFPTEEAPLTVADEELAWKEAAGPAEGAHVENVVSRKNTGRQHLSSVGKSVLFASATILVVWLASLQMLGKLQGLESGKAQPDAPDDQQPPLDYEADELHQLAAAADRVSTLLGEPLLEAAATELSQRVQELDRCYAVTQDVARRKHIDPAALKKARNRFNEELETLLDSTSEFLRHAVDPVRHLEEEASKKAALLEQEAEAANEAVKATSPHDFALAQRALVRKFASGAKDSKFTMERYVNTSREISASRPASIKDAAASVRRLMNNVSHMKKLSARALEDCSTVNSWKRFSNQSPVSVRKVESAILRHDLRVILEEVSLKHMTEAAAAVASKHQETLQKIKNIVKEAPSEEELASAGQITLLNMMEKLKNAKQQAREEVDSMLEDIKAELRAQGAGDDPSVYKDDEETLDTFRERVMLSVSLSIAYAGAMTEFVSAASQVPLHPHPQAQREAKQATSHVGQVAKLANAVQLIERRAEEADTVDAVMQQMEDLHAAQLNAFTEARRAEESALTKIAWDHVAGIATETVTAIDSMCKAIIKSDILSFGANAVNKLQQAKALMEDIKRTDDLKRAAQMALEMRCVYDDLSETMRYLPGGGMSSP